MKFNYKLGGTTFIIKLKTKYFKEPIIIININIFYTVPGLE
jgi:hypothetical protein